MQKHLPDIALENMRLARACSWGRGRGRGHYRLDDAALVGAGGERPEVDGALDAGLHVADHVELDVGLQERAGDLVEAVAEDLLVDDRGARHPRERAGEAPAELREHHRAGLAGAGALLSSLRRAVG